MEITKEIKAKVFAQYMWSKTTHSEYPILTPSEINENYKNNFKEEDMDVKLILKPLSSITNEDKEWIANLFEWKEVINIQVGAFLQELTNSEYTLYRADKTIIAIQFLQSKGYDLPNYLLGGKTLQEAGLAIYK